VYVCGLGAGRNARRASSTADNATATLEVDNEFGSQISVQISWLADRSHRLSLPRSAPHMGDSGHILFKLLRGIEWVILEGSSFCLLWSNPFVRSAPSFRPDLQARYAGARRGGQGWPAFGPPSARSVLDGREHDGMIERVGGLIP
jgi:hypothetical protein